LHKASRNKRRRRLEILPRRPYTTHALSATLISSNGLRSGAGSNGQHISAARLLLHSSTIIRFDGYLASNAAVSPCQRDRVADWLDWVCPGSARSAVPAFHPVACRSGSQSTKHEKRIGVSACPLPTPRFFEERHVLPREYTVLISRRSHTRPHRRPAQLTSRQACKATLNSIQVYQASPFSQEPAAGMA
jgi:hypothetical protein